MTAKEKFIRRARRRGKPLMSWILGRESGGLCEPGSARPAWANMGDTVSKKSKWVSETSKRVKHLPWKADDLLLIPRTHVVERKNGAGGGGTHL